MRIRELDLIAYGKFTNRKLSLSAAEHDFHVVVGPNEAGKSTVRRAITELLFGIERNSTLGFKHPQSDLRIGGVLETGSGRLEFVRTKQQKSLRSISGEQLPDTFLASAISNLNAEVFAQLHCLDHTGLIKGGQGIVERRNSLGQILFEAASGLESFATIREELGERAGQLFATRGKNNEFAKAAEQLSSAQKALKEQQVRTRDWVEAKDTFQNAENELTTERRHRAELEQQRATWERVRRLTPLMEKLTQAYEDLEGLGETIAFPVSAKTTLDAGIQEMNRAAGIVETRKNDVKVRCQQLEDIEVDEQVILHTADIEHLAKLCALFANHSRDLPRRQAEVDSWLADVLERSQEFNWGSTEESVRALVPVEKTLRAIGTLLKEHGTLNEAARGAIEGAEQRQSEFDDLQQRLAATREAIIDVRLSTALAQALPHKNSESKLNTQRTAVKLAATSLNNALIALGRAWITPESLRLMKLPSLERVTSLRNTRLELANQAAMARTHRDDAKGKVDSLDLQVKQFEASHKVVTAGEVNRSRHDRDTLWGNIKAGTISLPEGGPHLDTAIRLADELVDSRTISEADSASLQGLRDQLELNRYDECRHAKAVLEKERELREFDAKWAEDTANLGLDGMELDDFPDWLVRRDSALEAADQLAKSEHEFEQEREFVTRVRDELYAALTASGLSVSESASLAVLCDSADLHVKATNAARAARESLQQQVRDAQAALQLAQKSKLTKSTELESWSARWKAALQDANLTSAGVDLNDVEVALDAAKFIQLRLEKIDSHRLERISTMEADLEVVCKCASSLAQALELEMNKASPEELSRKLTERLGQAKLQANRRLQAQQFLEEAERQLAEAQSSLEQTRRQLEPLMKLAGVEDPLLAIPFVEKADSKRALETTIKTTTEQLQANSDGLTLEQIRAEVGTHPVVEAPGRLQAIKDSLEDSERKLTGLVETRTAAKQKFDAINGGASGALAEAQRQEAIADMAEAGEEYLQVATANSLLKWAVDKYRDRKQGPLLHRASVVFNTLTRGSFEKLRINYDEDPPILLAYRANGQSVKIAGLSDGTRDQLYLALRIAALELQSQNAMPVPFIADDLFINFDDNRSKAGLQALYDLSKKTQVLFLTHQEHLLSAINDLFHNVNVIKLDVEEINA